MVVSSLVACVAAAIIIVAFGTTSKFGVYAGTGKKYCISFHIMECHLLNFPIINHFRPVRFFPVVAVRSLLLLDRSEAGHHWQDRAGLLHWLRRGRICFSADFWRRFHLGGKPFLFGHHWNKGKPI